MRSYLDPRCLKEPAVKEVVWKISTNLLLLSQVLDSLLAWLNTSLADSRVRLVELEDDLKDGMVLKLILCKLTGQVVETEIYPRPFLEELELPCGDFVQSRERQKTNLEFVLQKIRWCLVIFPP